jgi:catechol 2,3-dioxygenase-like lactoylglutathione lyase family enzyme
VSARSKRPRYGDHGVGLERPRDATTQGGAMSVELNHIIIPSRDKAASSGFLAQILGLDPPRPVDHFMAVTVSNGVTLDYDDADEFRPQHCAFLVSDGEFDAIFSRVVDAQITYFADPSHRNSGEINHRSGGRGFYFADPDDHNMEVFTKVPLP